MVETGLFYTAYPFTLLGDLITTEQSPIHHPEGSVWNHTMMVIDLAATKKLLSSNPKVFMWAALLHDIGKAPTTKVRNGKITSYDHDKIGETLCSDFLEEFTNDKAFIYQVSKLVRWHMQTLFVIKNMPFADIKTMLSETSIDDIALLSLCDRLGRGDLSPEKIQEEKNVISKFLEKCKNFS